MTKTSIKNRISQRSVLLQISLAFLVFILIGANDGTGGVLIPSMGTHYGINKATVSLIFLFSTFGYLIASFNSGFLVRKLGLRRFLFMGATLVIMSLLFLSLTPPFIWFAACLLPLGFGTSILDTGLNVYMTGLPNSTVLLNYLHAFYGAGAWLGPVIASAFLAEHLPWNEVYIVWAALGLVILCGIFLIFKERTHQEVAVEEHVEKNVLWAVVKLRLSWAFALFFFFYVGIEIVLGSWSYSFLTEQRAIPALYAGWIVSGYWLGLMLGRVILGHVAQRIGEKLLIQFCVVGSALGVTLFWLSPLSTFTAVGLALVGFCLGPMFPTAIAMTSKTIAPSRVATAIGFVVSVGCVGGAFLPWIAGNIAQFIGVWAILPYAIVLTVFLMAMWLVLQTGLQRQKTVG